MFGRAKCPSQGELELAAARLRKEVPDFLKQIYLKGCETEVERGYASRILKGTEETIDLIPETVLLLLVSGGLDEAKRTYANNFFAFLMEAIQQHVDEFGHDTELHDILCAAKRAVNLFKEE